MAIFTKGFGISDLIDVIQDTAVTAAMIFLVLLGAEFFNSFIALTQITNQLASFVINNNVSPY